MRSIKALVLLLTLAAVPLSAQLTPDQRRERELLDLHRDYARLRADWTEQRALGGDPTAYAGPAAWQDHSFAYSARSWSQIRWRMAAPYPYRTHWGALDDSPHHAYALKRITDGEMKGDADKPMVLTLATPVGAPGRRLKIRTVLEGEQEGSGWNRTDEITADAEGRYVIEIPPFVAGKYELQIEIYAPDAPDTPYSSSLNTVKVE